MGRLTRERGGFVGEVAALAAASSATLTRPMSTGTSTRGPITAANAAPLWMPKLAMATAMASSKLLEAAVKDSVAERA
jgi:hypothetical protein